MLKCYDGHFKLTKILLPCVICQTYIFFVDLPEYEKSYTRNLLKKIQLKLLLLKLYSKLLNRRGYKVIIRVYGKCTQNFSMVNLNISHFLFSTKACCLFYEKNCQTKSRDRRWSNFISSQFFETTFP
jgi:hypothetical protein